MQSSLTFIRKANLNLAVHTVGEMQPVHHFQRNPDTQASGQITRLTCRQHHRCGSIGVHQGLVMCGTRRVHAVTFEKMELCTNERFKIIIGRSHLIYLFLS